MTRPKSGIGKIVLSIDLPSESAASGRRISSLAHDLFHMVDSRRLSASWAPSNLGNFALRDELATTPARHDLALVGDSSWIGKAAGRTRFARQLAGRVEAARADGIKVAAIALNDVELDDHFDLLVKHRVGMIRGRQIGSNTRLQPRSIRFGVWYSPVSDVLPQAKGRSWFGANRSLRQTVRRVTRSADVAHLVIDAHRLASDAAAFGELDLALAHLQRQRDQGALVVTSLAGLANSLVRRPTAKKTTSILHAA